MKLKLFFLKQKASLQYKFKLRSRRMGGTTVQFSTLSGNRRQMSGRRKRHRNPFKGLYSLKNRTSAVLFPSTRSKELSRINSSLNLSAGFSFPFLYSIYGVPAFRTTYVKSNNPRYPSAWNDYPSLKGKGSRRLTSLKTFSYS